MSPEDDLHLWAEGRRADAPTSAEADALVARAAGGRSRIWFAIPALTGAAALGFAAIALVLFARPDPVVEPLPDPAPVQVAQEVLTGHIERDGDVFEVEGRLVVGPDRYELDGSVLVQAAPRGDGPPLAIAASGYVVEVIGTRFEVVSDPFSVVVTEGVVAVRHAEDSWELTAGDLFEEGKLIRPVPAPPLPSLTELRRMLVEGDLAGTRAGVTQRLAANDRDVGAWTLKAQLESRAENDVDAIAAWIRVTDLADPAAAQRARYEAAILWGTDPACIPLLREFLRTPDPLAPEATLRLADALLASGDQEGTVQLERLVREHPGTAAAQQAQARLDDIEKP